MHGRAPVGLTKIMVHPIPKDKRKSVSDSNNYRGIALNSICCKLFDCFIMAENMEALSTSDLQFWFKCNASTTQCTFVSSECVNYYMPYESNVNRTLLGD